MIQQTIVRAVTYQLIRQLAPNTYLKKVVYLATILLVAIYIGESHAQPIQGTAPDVTTVAGQTRPQEIEGEGEGLCEWDSRGRAIITSGYREWEFATCEGGVFDANIPSDKKCGPYTRQSQLIESPSTYAYKCPLEKTFSQDYCASGSYPSYEGGPCVRDEEQCPDFENEHVVSGECVCISDNQPNAVTGSCDRDPLQYCEATNSYISASADCIDNSCSNDVYAQLNPAECNPAEEEPDEPQCTADYYTDPVTREIVCGTLVTNHGNGSVTSHSTNSDGTTTTTTTNPDGTTVNNTVFPDGSATTTVTNNNTGQTSVVYSQSGGGGGVAQSGGSGGYGQSTSGGEGDEPRKSAAIGASCGSPPACSGDAIQCALLWEAWKQRCISEGDREQVPLPSPFDFLTQGGFNEDGTELFAERQEVDVSNIVLDAAGFMSPAVECPALGTINVGGRVITLEVTNLCDLAEKLGWLVLAFAYFRAGVIIMESW